MSPSSSVAVTGTPTSLPAPVFSAMVRVAVSAGEGRGIVNVSDGNGHRDSVGLAGRVGGGNRHRVGVLGLVVQRGLGPQLSGSLGDVEGCGIRPSQRVGQYVAVFIRGCDWNADVLTRPRVLGDGAGSRLIGESRRLVA